MGKSKISVIVPVYNVEKYLHKCVDSIINQTYKNLEIILVDDGSPDNCPKICDDYVKQDERVKVVHKENAGVSAARNTGIRAATGDYVCFFDGDDFIEKNMVEKMLDAIEKKGCDICVCGYSVDFYDNLDKEETVKIVIPWNQPSEQKSLIEYEKHLGICGYVWNKLYSVNLLKLLELNFDEEISLYEDLIFNSKAFCEGAKVCFIDNIGYHYIQRQRETLGVKYYDNLVSLSLKAIKARRDILTIWGVEEEQIENICNSQFIDVVWGAIKSIKNAKFSTSEKKQKIRRLFKEEDIKTKLKSFKLQDKKRKIKKFIIKNLNATILLKVVK